MKLTPISVSIAALICLATALPAEAAPKLIGADQLKAGKTTFSLFYMDPSKLKGISVNVAQQTLQQRLNSAGEGITACFLTADVNDSNISCGGNLLRLGADLFSTTQGTNHLNPVIAWQEPQDKDSGLQKTSNEFAINSRSSTTITSPVDFPRALHIRFGRRVAQFGFNVDPYSFNTDPTFPANEGKVIDGVQFIVNGQPTPVRTFSTELRGDTPFVGVEDAHGFTEVMVIPSSGSMLKPDRYTIVPLSNF